MRTDLKRSTSIFTFHSFSAYFLYCTYPCKLTDSVRLMTYVASLVRIPSIFAGQRIWPDVENFLILRVGGGFFVYFLRSSCLILVFY